MPSFQLLQARCRGYNLAPSALTDALPVDEVADAVLVALEDLDTLVKVVDPGAGRQVGACREEHLGGHHEVEDHAAVTLESLQQTPVSGKARYTIQ